MNRSSSVEFVNASCRFSTTGHYEPSIFRSIACAQCFFYIFLAQSPYNFSMNTKICSDGLLACDLGDSNCNCQTSKYPKYNLLEFSNSPLVLPIRELQIDPPLPEGFEESTRDCCKTAEKCCFEVLQHDIESEGTCPSTWDGWQCFNRTKPGVARQYCPSYIYGNHWHRRVENGAEKKCNNNGTWELVMRNGVLREQTNYMSCHHEDFWLRPLLLCTFIAYCISALTIVPALLLLSCNRRLKNMNIFLIHRQLLTSLLLDSICYIVNTLLFMPSFNLQGQLFFQNHPICRLLFVLQYGYFRLTSFAWMLVEALHLHWLLFRTPSNHIESVNRMLFWTWASPAIISVIYGVLIEYYEPERCMPEAKTPLIKALITIPCAMCLMINTVILIITVRLILQKLRSNQVNTSVRNYRKVMHALLVLIPLFGVNLASAVYSTESDWHDIVNMFVNGFEGFIVSIIVCYANRTVIRSITRWPKSNQPSFRQNRGVSRCQLILQQEEDTQSTLVRLASF
ncbi:hypothetical protein M3Y98_00266900 [Aphelenchoides besseyi]|nr:hypothetical protein M3Y98_00266900 [Aphelenchoides besseyi]